VVVDEMGRKNNQLSKKKKNFKKAEMHLKRKGTFTHFKNIISMKKNKNPISLSHHQIDRPGMVFLSC